MYCVPDRCPLQIYVVIQVYCFLVPMRKYYLVPVSKFNDYKKERKFDFYNTFKTNWTQHETQAQKKSCTVDK